jgi:hypothetical protein
MKGSIYDGQPITRWFDVVIISGYLCLAFYFMAMGLQIEREDQSLVVYMGNKFVGCAASGVVIIAILVNFVNRKRVHRLVGSIYKTDCHIENLFQQKIDHNWTFLVTVFFTTFMSLFLNIGVAFQMYEHFNWTKFFMCFYSNMSYYILSSTFIVFAYAMYQRFAFLVQIFQDIFLGTSDKVLKVKSNLADQKSSIRELSKAYSKYADIVNMINYCFSLQTLLCIWSIFIYGVFSALTFYLMIWKNTDKEFTLAPYTFLVWMGYYSILVLAISYVGSVLARKGEEMSVLLNKAIHRSKDEEVSEMVIIFVAFSKIGIIMSFTLAATSVCDANWPSIAGTDMWSVSFRLDIDLFGETFVLPIFRRFKIILLLFR